MNFINCSSKIWKTVIRLTGLVQPLTALLPELLAEWPEVAKTPPIEGVLASNNIFRSIPLAVESTPANQPDIQEMLPMVISSGPRDEKGEPRRLPKRLYGDRAYDSEPHREKRRALGMEPQLARRREGHGSHLGVYRWVVERTISWLHGFRKIRMVTEKTEEMQLAFLNLATAIVCFRFLHPL